MSECEILAKKFFKKDKYEIKEVTDLGNKCLVDFVRKDYEPNMDCEDYCSMITETDEEYEDCLETCKLNLEASTIGSVTFDKETLSVESSTIPGTCEYVWMSEGEEPEEFQRKQEKLFNEFREKGCEIKESWIHPHEIAWGREWEEEPAICYYHPRAKHKGRCKLPSVLKIVEEKL